MRTRTRLAALLAIVVLSGLASQTALGYWSGAGSAGNGDGGTAAATLQQGAAPTVSENGSANVVVRWGSAGLSTGLPADGYLVKRFNAETGSQVAIGGGCSGTVDGTTCNVPGTPVGNWKYSVTPVFGNNWQGEEGLKSGSVNTGPGSMTLSRELFGGTVAPLPATVSGSVSGFDPGEPIEYLLDGTVPLVGSPSQAGAEGGATVSITLPLGTADGPHSVSVVGVGAEASSGILVDNTAPSFQISVVPPPNAAGWNRTPVEVGGTPDDGNGSGVAYAKYTDDGSDPKTSPTAQYVTLGPVQISTSATVKFYLADNAGNESPVQTQVIKIDAMPPYFTADVIDVQGGYYEEPADLATGTPGTTFYRGAAAGSFRIRLTPVPLGGSPAVAAGFSEQDPNGIGFSFDSTSVTTPVGGPFVSGLLSWVAGTTANAGGAISLTNEAGATFGASGTTYNDSTPPSGGSVEVVGLAGTDGHYSATLEVDLQLAKGSDSGSGLADGSGPRDPPAKLERATAPLSASNGIVEGSCGTFSGFAQIGADNPGATVTDTVPTDDSCYLYRYLVPDHVGNFATYTSPEIKVQTAAAASLTPTDAVLSAVSGTTSQSISGSTVFYNPARSGSFNVDTSASAPYSGVARVTFPTISGFSGGGAVASPLSGTTFRTTYSWSANGADPSPGPEPIAATNNAGQTATNPTAFTVTKDETGPSGGAVDAIGLGGTGGRYSTLTTLSIGFTPGSDSGSGLAPSGAQLLRASAALTSDGSGEGICGSFGSYSQVGANDPPSPRADTVPADGTCYRYAYLVTDKVGNPSTYFSPEVKVDASAPSAPALSFSALSNAYWSGAGTVVYYRPGAGSGGFQVTASSTDPHVGISGYAFPTFPAGWSAGPGATGIRTYSWSAPNPTAPSGAQTVTATNNAGAVASSSFTAVPDSTPPSGGTITYTNGYSTATTLSATFTKGTDTGSGLNSASGIVERSTATLAAGVCGTFGAFTVAATNSVSPTSIAVTSGNCYQFRYLISDNVGNQATYVSAGISKVDTVAPTNTLSLPSAVNAALTGTVIYYRGNVAGSFNIVNLVADASSGPASATFPAIATTGWTHNLETISTPVGGPFASTAFSWTALPTAPTAKTLSGKDAAGKSTNTSVSFVNDILAPTGGSITYLNGTVKTLSVPLTTSDGTDTGSGVNAAAGIVRRDEATLNTATGICGSFPGTFATAVARVGGADTSVTSGRCYQYRYLAFDRVGNQATYTSANVVKVDTAGPQVTAISSRQSNGTTGNGRLEIGDKLILTFNQPLATASVPTSFSGASETSPGIFANVMLTIPGITNGALDTGSVFYLASASATATFGGTVALVNNGVATTVTIVVTSLSGAATGFGSGSLVFKPATTITEASGIPAGGTFTTEVFFGLF